MPIDHATCHLCEAICGIDVDHDGARVSAIRGDDLDLFSRGHVCPKAVGLKDVHEDPDRLKRPLKRTGQGWKEIGWDEALDEAASRLTDLQRRHGRDAVAFYLGNPTGHSYSSLLFLPLLQQTLRTRSFFGSNSVDALPRLLTSYLMYGHQAALPVPDLERTKLFVILGANPAVSNGSIMTVPDFRRRVRELRARGGRLVVIDPRRTETAALADDHLFIRPGADALFLLSMLHTIFAEGLESTALAVDGLEELRALVADFAPERLASATGIPADRCRTLAREIATTPEAACYGRMGTTVQPFGAMASWLIDVVNIVTGHLDRPGGAMFPTPAVDLVGIASMLGQTGSFGRYRSRVSGRPEFNRELPVAVLAEEMETPGPGQIRGLIVHAGNPVLSLPNGPRLEKAIGGLDFVLSIDIYLNETSRLADIILPSTFGLETDHYPLLFHALAIRNTAKYSPAILTPDPDARHGWQILLELSTRMLSRGNLLERAAGWIARRFLGRVGPEGLLDFLIRVGPWGKGYGPLEKREGLTLETLKKAPHGLDLGPLEPRLAKLIQTPGKRIRLTPKPLIEDLPRLRQHLEQLESGSDDSLLLIGRRQLRGNNSWMHNSQRLVKGRETCTLLMHPADAETRGLADGRKVRLMSRTGALEVTLEVSDEVMPGVVSLPHGWGHGREGMRLSVASSHAGVSANDVTDEGLFDAVSGASTLNGVPVRVEALGAAEAAPDLAV